MLPVNISNPELGRLTGQQPQQGQQDTGLGRPMQAAAPQAGQAPAAKPKDSKEEPDPEELRDVLIAAAIRSFTASIEYQNKVKMPAKYTDTGR